MAKFTVRAYDPDGRLAFGLTLNCHDEEQAMVLFVGLPLEGRAAELLLDGRVIQSMPRADERRGVAPPSRQTGG